MPWINNILLEHFKQRCVGFRKKGSSKVYHRLQSCMFTLRSAHLLRLQITESTLILPELQQQPRAAAPTREPLQPPKHPLPSAARHKARAAGGCAPCKEQTQQEQPVPKESPPLSTPPHGNSPVWPCCGLPGLARQCQHTWAPAVCSELCLPRRDSLILLPWGQTAAPRGIPPCQGHPPPAPPNTHVPLTVPVTSSLSPLDGISQAGHRPRAEHWRGFLRNSFLSPPNQQQDQRRAAGTC